MITIRWWTGWCPKHKTYKAKHKPRVLCEPCWALWFLNNDIFDGIEAISKAGVKEKYSDQAS